MVNKVLINASNLHVGGGIQVASSFLFELMSERKTPWNLSIVVSKEVQETISVLVQEINKFEEYEVIDVHGLKFIPGALDRKMNKYDTVFTIFGPLYRLRSPFKSIVGFAQPWIIYPNNECYAMLPFVQRIKTRLKYWIQSKFFKQADVLVVELEHVKQRLISLLGVPAERIHVVHNCISSIYLDKSVWRPVDFPMTDGYLRLGFLGRNYLHKNTAIFPAVAANLEQVHGIKAKFYVTFTDNEWVKCPAEFREVCINVGPLAVAECPHFYQSLDGVVFPSLLECFSATPLEAMAMGKPLFASDRAFNRDICGSHAHYFDPMSPASAAQSIAGVFCGVGPDPDSLRAAREYAIGFSSPKERARKYMALLKCDTPV